MHIAYSAIRQQDCPDQESCDFQPNHEKLIRYQVYEETCAKYYKEIAAIQKYLPGWMPVFR